MRANDHHLFIGAELWQALSGYAKGKQVSVSNAVRELIGEGLGVQDTVRKYQEDNEHSRASVQRKQLDRILSNLPCY